MRVYCILLLFAVLTTGNAQSGSALLLEGKSGYIHVGNVHNLGTSDFTIEAWVYVAGFSTGEHKIMNKGLTSVGRPANAGYGLRTDRHDLGDMEFNVCGEKGGFYSLLHQGLKKNRWYHIAGVRAGKMLKLYIDGVLVDHKITDHLLNVDNDSPLVVGAIHKGNRSNTTGFFDGKLDEVRIWRRALSEEEIMIFKECAITNPVENLLLVYGFDADKGRQVKDNSGHSHHGTLRGYCSWVRSPVAPVCTVAK